MGGQQSQTKTYSLIINHPKFKANDMQQPFYSGNDLIRVTIPIQQDCQFHQWEKSLNKIVQMQDQSFLLPKNYQFNRKNICASSGILKVDYDAYPYILEDQIDNRLKPQRNQQINQKNFKKYFEQEQMWYLLYVLVQSVHLFRSYQQKVGDIRPRNIFINDTGQIKLSCKYSWPSELQNYTKSLLEKEITYLAPEQVLELALSRSQQGSNKQIAESFSIGLTMLHSGLLQKLYVLYESNPIKFNIQLFNNLKQKWSNLQFYSEQKKCYLRYSQNLKYAILGLCEVNPQNRVTAAQIYQWLKPYQCDIINLKPIHLDKTLQKFAKYTQPKMNNSQNNSMNKYNRTSPQRINQTNINNNPNNTTLISNSLQNTGNVNQTEKFRMLESMHKPTHLPHYTQSNTPYNSKPMPQRQLSYQNKLGGIEKSLLRTGSLPKSTNILSTPNNTITLGKPTNTHLVSSFNINNNSPANRIPQKNTVNLQQNLHQNQFQTNNVNLHSMNINYTHNTNKPIVQNKTQNWNNFRNVTTHIKQVPQNAIDTKHMDEILKNVDERIFKSKYMFPS